MAQPRSVSRSGGSRRRSGRRSWSAVPRVALTEAGVVFLEAARRTLAQIALAIDAAGRVWRALGKADGRDRLIRRVHTLAQAFRAYQRTLPRVELQLPRNAFGAQLEALRAGTIDVGLLRNHDRRGSRHGNRGS